MRETRHRRRGGREPLSREQIVGAAMEIADTEGLDAVSIRRIAARLGSGATSLYRHVASKEDIYELMVDAYIGEIELLERPSGDWRADLRVVAGQIRAAIQRHRWVPQLGVQTGLGPNSLRYIEFAAATMAELDLDGDGVRIILAALNNYVLGFAQRETARDRALVRSGLSEQDWSTRVREYAERVVSERSPALGRMVMTTMDMATDEGFAFGLDSLLDGIALRIPELQRRRGLRRDG
jgi:AcrR family transcriptional regulator